jgi:hypothetical protein
VVELEETLLCDNASDKTVITAEGYNNQEIAEEYRYLKQTQKTVGIRFFSDYGLYYPRCASEVILDVLRIYYCLTPIVIAVNPLTAFFKSVYGTKNEEEVKSLFTLFFHRLLHPKAYLFSKNVNKEIVSLLQKITYPEPPVVAYKDIDMPIVKSFELIQQQRELF